MVFYDTPQPIQRALQSWRSFALFAFIAIILASSVAMVFTPALDAAAKRASDMSIDEQLRSFTYLNTLTGCFDKKGKPQGVTTDVSSWFDNSSSGYVYPNTTAEEDCSSIMNKALDLWGYGGNTIKFLTDMGYTNTGLYYAAEVDKAGLKANLIKIVSMQVYSTDTQSRSAPLQEHELGQAALYILHANTFNAHCSPQYLGDTTKLTGDNKEKVEGNTTEEQDGIRYAYRTMNTISDDGTRMTEGLRYARDNLGTSSSVNGAPTQGRSNPIEVTLYGYKSSQAITTCKQLSDDMWSNIDAFIRYRQNNPDEPLPSGATTSCTGDNCAAGETTVTCAIPGVGWLVCPVVTMMGIIVDSIYGWLVSYVKVPAINSDTTDTTNTLYIAWTYMRNLANVAFVVAFMIIIYSQLTSVGISNYSIKKLLPRIIIAAILVNVSFWITAIAVDVSNILGSSIYNLLMGMPLGNIVIAQDVWENVLSTLLAGGVLTLGVVAGGAAIAAGGVGAVMSAAGWAIIPVVLAIVLGLIVTFAVLAARQALVIILIILGPLAFVALLLPNTDKFFTLWRKSLTTMLIFYPLFSMLFAGAHIASLIILGSAGGASSDADGNDPAAGGMIIVLALAVQIAPLWLVPFLVKFSSGIVGKIAGMVNNKNKGLIDRSKKVAERKRGLAMHETFGHANNAKNPFGRVYRRLTNNGMRDKDRQSAIDGENGAAYERQQSLYDRINNSQATTKVYDTNQETSRLASDAGKTLTHALMQADLEKKISENVGQTQAKINIPIDLHMKALATTDDLKAVDIDYGQLYEEVKVQNPDASAPKHALYNQVAAGTVQLAQDAQRKSDIASSATNNAKRVQQLEYADAINSSDRRASKAGGIDPYGAQRARTQATVTIDKALDEAVSGEKATLGAIGDDAINDAVVKYPALAAIRSAHIANPTANANVSANDVLASTRDDTSLSLERRMAAQSMIVQASNEKNMVAEVQSLSTMLSTAKTSLATAKTSGNVAAIEAASKDVEIAVHLQKQLFSDGAGKLPSSITGSTKGALSNGNYTGNIELDVLSKFNEGAYSASGLASMSAHQAKWVADVIQKYQADPAWSSVYASRGPQLKADIADYHIAAKAQGKTVSGDIGGAMSRIRSAI